MIARGLAAIALSALAAGSIEAAEIAYSPTNGPACVTIRSKREFNSWRCPGPSGYSARFSDLGNMVAVEFGPTGKEKAVVEDGLMWQGVDNSFGDKIEWRLADGKPFAAIMRIRRQDFDEKLDKVRDFEDFLVIKVSAQGACRIGAVDAQHRDAIDIARDLADKTAPLFRCGRDQPRAASAASR